MSPPGAAAHRGPMIHVDHLVKRYGGHTAVDDVSFTCRPGTVTGFLGPNGAGKSTTLRMMTGLTPPSAGRVTIDGMPYAAHPNPGRVVGVMLDASAQHPGRTGHRDAAPAARLLGAPAHAGRRDARAGRPRRGRPAPRRRLLARHAPAPRHRHRAARRPRRADPRRAGQRHGPRGHPLDAPACCTTSPPAAARCCCRATCSARCRRPSTASSSSAAAGSSPTTPSQALLAGQGTTVRGLDPAALDAALRPGRLRPPSPAPTARCASEATAEQVGRVAAASRAGRSLELRDGDGTGLEDLFFRAHRARADQPLTATDPRPRKEPTDDHHHPHPPRRRRRAADPAAALLDADSRRAAQDDRHPQRPLAARRDPRRSSPPCSSGRSPTPRSRRRSTTTAPASPTFVAFLAPLIGLLAMTSEWTQRTALTTFTLAPRRLPGARRQVRRRRRRCRSPCSPSGLVMAAGGDGHRRARPRPAPASPAGSATSATPSIFVVLQVDDGRRLRRPRRQHAGGRSAPSWSPRRVGDRSPTAAAAGGRPWFDVFAAYDRLSSDAPVRPPRPDAHRPRHLGRRPAAAGLGRPAPGGQVSSRRAAERPAAFRR